METALPLDSEQPAQKTPQIQQSTQSITFHKEQIELLNQVVDKQIKQERTIDELKAQNSELLRMFASILKNRSEQYDGMAHVKVENINMPFWAMVGFLIKLSFAAIPAAILMAILSFILIVILAAIGFVPLLLGLSQAVQ